MAGERKGEMLQGVKKECHRVKEELQDQLTASEGEQQSQHLVYKHAMEEEDARDRSFKMRKRLFKASSRLP